jgi:hypothetical protein
MDNLDKKENKKTTEDAPVMHSFTEKQQAVSPMKLIIFLGVIALIGVGTGYGLAQFSARTGTSIVPAALNPNAPQKGKTYGTGDEKTFSDTAEGTLREGGIEGEGQYHLERTGGESQNVYMTSSSVDLSQFMGKKIKVWGQTQKAQTAGWLMDVGKVEVL